MRRRRRNSSVWVVVPEAFERALRASRKGGVSRVGVAWYPEEVFVGLLGGFSRSKHQLAAWLTQLEARIHPNIAAVALASGEGSGPSPNTLIHSSRSSNPFVRTRDWQQILDQRMPPTDHG